MWRIVAVIGIGLGTLSTGIWGQARTPRTPNVLTISSLAGKDTFEAYCAPCHGRTGGGDGPVGSVLRTPPADLRRLSKVRGHFPEEEIAAFVSGTARPVAAHGTSDMPVWGPIFRELDPSSPRVNVRIRNVVEYVKSLQQ